MEDNRDSNKELDPITEKDERDFTKANLFFIKSKHAFRQYKNHDYFQNHTQTHQYNQHKKMKEFVQFPTPYGISHAYDYICEEISKNYQRKPSFSRKRVKTESENQLLQQKIKHHNFSVQKSRKNNLTLPNLSQTKKIDHFQTNHFSRQRNDTVKLKIQKVQKQKQRFEPKTQQIVCLIFIDQLQQLSKVGSCELKLNIYNYLIKTFLKSKINYRQITQKHFQVIRQAIRQIFHIQKQTIQYKDIVNVRSIDQIFELLQSNKDDQIYCQQLMRYFFISTQQIYEYQFNKIKDEVKKLISFQFNKDVNNQDLFIYDTKTGNQIKNLHQLISHQGKFIFGTTNQAVNLYQLAIKHKDSQIKIANRIKKWKSAFPQDITSSQFYNCITADKYHKLFNSVQQRRDKFPRSRKRATVFKNSQFIDKQKLCHDQNIFQ